MYGKMNMVFIYAGAFAGYCAYKKFSKPAVSKINDKKSTCDYKVLGTYELCDKKFTFQVNNVY